MDEISFFKAVKSENIEALSQMDCARYVNKFENDYCALHIAALVGNEKLVRFLFEQGADIEVKTKEKKNTALQIACLKGHLEVVKILLKHDADIEVVNQDGETPLCISITGNKKEITNFLIYCGADIENNKVKEVSSKVNFELNKMALRIMTPKDNVLIQAIKNKNITKLKVLLTVNVLSGKSPVDVKKFKSHSGLPAWVLAVKYDNVAALDFMFKEFKIEDKDTIFELYDYSIKNDSAGAFKFLIEKFPYLKEDYSAVVERVIKFDAVNSFKVLLSEMPLQEKDLSEAQGKIQALLSYKPATREENKEKYESIGEYCINPERNSNKLKKLVDDYENTSEEESSDSENDDFCIVSNSQGSSPITLYRGINFSPTYFEAKERREAKGEAYHKKPVYSRATQELEVTHKKTLEEADILIKNYFTLLKITPDKKEFKEDYTRQVRTVGGKEKMFDSLYHRFVHVYTNQNGFDSLFDKKGMQRNFNFFSSKNPTLSTSKSSSCAAAYVSGEKFVAGLSLFSPKTRKSTGAFKHRRFGYIQAYKIDDDYFKKHAVNVDILDQEGKISISSNFRHNKEVLIESSIQEKHLCGYQIFSLPSFNESWSQAIEEYYGISKAKYNIYKNSLKNGESTDEMIKKLTKEVTAHQVKRLDKSMEEMRKSAQEYRDFMLLLIQRKNELGSIQQKIEYYNSGKYKSDLEELSGKSNSGDFGDKAETHMERSRLLENIETIKMNISNGSYDEKVNFLIKHIGALVVQLNELNAKNKFGHEEIDVNAFRPKQ